MESVMTTMICFAISFQSKSQLKSTECISRYAFYDYEYQFNPQGGDSVMRSKLFLLNWCPETSAINKMLYASSFDSLKRAFEGVKILQANDFSDIEKDAVEKELRALDRT